MSSKIEWTADDSGYPRLEDQIAWYDKRSQSAQKFFRFLKVVQILVATSIPVMSLVNPGDAKIRAPWER